jgi:glycogen operon protein
MPTTAAGPRTGLNVAHPRVTQFVLDSLRYWAYEMGVDGFRFDLAPVLGRTHHAFDAHAPFFIALAQDPILTRARMVAEAWDSGPEGYQVGRFPGRWGEWNDKFRDSVRRYWLHRGVSRGEFARRFTASNDLFHHGRRSPLVSVNFISAHDGFTLADFTSYSKKRNHANGENNRDGRDDEVAANLGVEGPSDNATIAERRGRVRRALLATLLLAQGTPMLLAGDEIGHSQQGNNNAYSQDNPTSWLDWANADAKLLAFVQNVLALRREEPALRHGRWFQHMPAIAGERSVVWLSPTGHDMQMHDWHDSAQHAFGCRIDASPDNGQGDGQGCRHLLIAFNPEPRRTPFTLPAGTWELALDTAGELTAVVPHKPLPVPAHALVVLRGITH